MTANRRETSPAPTPHEWHRLSHGDALERLGGDARRGLDAAQAGVRLARHGPNELAEGSRRSPWLMLVGQFTDFMILVLLAAAVVAGLVGEPGDAVAIVVIVVLNAVVGFAQEYRAERTMAALRRLAAPHARVIRDGVAADVPAASLVPGDVVLLEAGNVVPADLRLIEAARLQVQESALTGESVPVEKQVEALAGDEAPLAERTNMAYKGTIVTQGRGGAASSRPRGWRRNWAGSPPCSKARAKAGRPCSVASRSSGGASRSGPSPSAPSSSRRDSREASPRP
jgi:Ca2+-transporting ATPase